MWPLRLEAGRGIGKKLSAAVEPELVEIAGGAGAVHSGEVSIATGIESESAIATRRVNDDFHLILARRPDSVVDSTWREFRTDRQTTARRVQYGIGVVLDEWK
jgi:hypothetical protein